MPFSSGTMVLALEVTPACYLKFTKHKPNSVLVHKTIGSIIWCTQFCRLVTIFVATARLLHNIEILASNGHILNNVYKNGSIFASSRRISMERNVTKNGSKMTMVTILYTKYCGWQKCTLANLGHNSLLDETGCTQMHCIPSLPWSHADNNMIHRDYVLQMLYKESTVPC